MAKSECLELGKRESADCASHVPQSIAAGIPICFSIWRRSNPDPVENDDGGAPHQGFGIVCT
jgi:hypothetical protein